MKISVVLEALTGSFETDLARASKTAQRRMRDMRKTFNSSAKAIGLASVAVAGSMAVIVKSTAKTADEYAKMARETGVAVESLSQLDYAAQINGSNLGELSKGLARLSRNASDAANGLKTPLRAFEFLNIEFKDAEGNLRATEDILLDVADKFSKMEDGTKKAALAQELFGRSGVKLINLLNQGRDGIQALREEADALGLTFDTEAAKAAERFNDNMLRLRSVVKGFSNQVVQALLPNLAAFTESMVDAAKETGGFKKEAQSAAESVVGAIAFVTDAVDGFGRVVETLADGLVILWAYMQRGVLGLADSIYNGPITAINFIIRQVNKIPGIDIDELGISEVGQEIQAQMRITEGVIAEAIANIKNNLNEPLAGQAFLKRLEEYREKVSAALNKGNPGGSPGGSGNEETEEQKKLKKAIDAARLSLQGMIADNKQAIDTFGDSADVVLAYRLASGDLADQVALLGEEGQKYAEILIEQAIQQERNTEAQEAAEKAATALQKRLEDAKRIYEETRTPVEQLQAEIARLNELRNTPITSGGIDQETYERAVKQAQDTYDSTQETFFDIEEAAKEMSRNVHNALADFLFDPFQNGLDGMLEGFVTLLRRMAAEAAAAQILKSFGGFAGIAGSVASFFGGGKAQGGPVQAGRSYLVGERGPEMFVPSVAGSITPNSNGDVTVNLVESANKAGTVDRRRDRSGQDIIDIFVADIRGGGAAASAIETTFGTRRVGR